MNKRICGCKSTDNLLDVGTFNSCYVCVHVLVHCLQLVCILLQLHEFLLQRVQVVHCVRKRVYHRTGGTAHLCYLVSQLLHLLHLLRHLLTFLFPLLLQFLSSLHLSLSFLLFLLFFLNLQNSVIHLDQKMRKLRVDLVDQVAEVSCSFIINSFEKHHSLKILSKIFNFLWVS